MKSLSKLLLIAYLLTLLWLVLFKFSVNLPEVLNVHIRGLNLIPFAGAQDHPGEMIDNFVVFVPLGLLMAMNLKRITLWEKFSSIFFLSLMVETIQFLLAIGVADITDVITNTLGGFCGLAAYHVGSKCIDSKKQDQLIVVVCILLLIIVFYLRFFVFRIRY